MPRNVLPPLLQSLRREIRLRYAAGAPFLSTRALAAKFEVSLQTAHRAIRHLEAEGFLETRPRMGIVVINPAPNGIADRRIALLTSNADLHFNRAFLLGVEEACLPAKATVVLKLHAETPMRDSVEFGRQIVAMGYDGMIALGFRDTPLAFYHAVREGVDIVSDVEMDGLQGTLPSLQTDNRRHCEKVAAALLRSGKRRILAGGYWSSRPNRLRYFEDAIGNRAKVTAVCLSRPEAVGHLHKFFHEFPTDGAVFSLDSSANWILAPLFLQFGVSPRGRFFLYDSEETEFVFPGIPALKGAAPSLKYLGRRLAEKLLYKWEHGVWREPINERI